MPMLEEWRCGDGIEVLDGWTFQVYRLFTNLITDLMSLFLQFSSESVRLFPEMAEMTNIDFY